MAQPHDSGSPWPPLAAPSLSRFQGGSLSDSRAMTQPQLKGKAETNSEHGRVGLTCSGSDGTQGRLLLDNVLMVEVISAGDLCGAGTCAPHLKARFPHVVNVNWSPPFMGKLRYSLRQYV